MKFLKDLLSENSNVSMMRLMCLIVCCTACYISITKRADELGVISVLLGTAFSSKIAQKKIEVDGLKKDSIDEKTLQKM